MTSREHIVKSIVEGVTTSDAAFVVFVSGSQAHSACLPPTSDEAAVNLLMGVLHALPKTFSKKTVVTQ